MANADRELRASQISKVTDIISADKRFRFCVEYLEIDRNEYKTIESDNKFIHHDVLFDCIERWKNRMDGNDLDAKGELYQLLTKVQEERHWFMKEDLLFLTSLDDTAVKMSPKRKYDKINPGMDKLPGLATIMFAPNLRVNIPILPEALLTFASKSCGPSQAAK